MILTKLLSTWKAHNQFKMIRHTKLTPHFCKNCLEGLRDNRTSYCSNQCQKEWTRKQYYLNFKSKAKELIKTKCDVCGSEFGKKHRHHKICSDNCRRKRREDIKNHKYIDNGVSKFLKLRFYIFNRDNFTCQYCGRNIKKDNIKLHCDHIIPKIKGGKDIPGNLITSCEDCNLGKSDCLLNKRESIKDTMEV